MNTEQNKISKQVEQWIAFQDLQKKPVLKPIRIFDGLYPEDEGERTAYFDFIHWTMTREHQVLFSMPTVGNDGFRKLEIDETGDDISAFNNEKRMLLITCQ